MAKLKVYGPRRDVHSGAASGPAPNAAVELSRLLGALHDDKGRLTLPGFYDEVAEPSERRRAELAALPFTEQDWLERSETRSVTGEAGYTVLEKLWTRPAAEIISLVAGDPIGVTRSAIPAGRMGNAGGGPAELLARELDAPVLFFGVGLPEDRWHDSDERVSIDMLVNGAATLAYLWQRLA